MAKNDLNDLIKKLDRVQNHLGEEIAPAVNELLKESVYHSLINWYNDYNPEDYERTYNFMRILESTRTSAKGNVLLLSVDSGNMHNYHGWTGVYLRNDGSGVGKNRLTANYAFDFMFMNGEHGHGRWMMHQSTPPYLYVESEIYSGFKGKVNKVINSTIERILKR